MYLKYTLEFRIWYSASSSLDLVGFSNADFAGCGIDRKSTPSTCHFHKSSLVCWYSCKQSSVPQSTIEIEYVAVVDQNPPMGVDRQHESREARSLYLSAL
jgi:hypothetical protein